MESVILALAPALGALLLIRLLAAPIRLAWKLVLHTACGFGCLWILSTAAPLTGIVLPINSLTVAIAGFGGLPGIALLAWLG